VPPAVEFDNAYFVVSPPWAEGMPAEFGMEDGERGREKRCRVSSGQWSVVNGIDPIGPISPIASDY